MQIRKKGRKKEKKGREKGLMVTTTSFVKTRERKRKGERKEEKEEKLQRHITTTTTVSCGAFVLECGCVRACVKNKNKIKKLSMISCLHASSRFSSFCRLCFFVC